MNDNYITAIDLAFDYEAANRQITIDNIINETDKPLINNSVIMIKKSYSPMIMGNVELEWINMHFDYTKLV